MGKINDSIQLVKSGLDVQVHLATAEEKEKLANAKLALADLKDDMADLKDENSRLREMLRKKDTYVLEKGVMWDSGDSERDQPYCPACFARDLTMPLQKQWAGRIKSQTPWTCPNNECKKSYNPWDHKESRSSIRF